MGLAVGLPECVFAHADFYGDICGRGRHAGVLACGDTHLRPYILLHGVSVGHLIRLCRRHSAPGAAPQTILHLRLAGTPHAGRTSCARTGGNTQRLGLPAHALRPLHGLRAHGGESHSPSSRPQSYRGGIYRHYYCRGHSHRGGRDGGVVAARSTDVQHRVPHRHNTGHRQPPQPLSYRNRPRCLHALR